MKMNKLVIFVMILIVVTIISSVSVFSTQCTYYRYSSGVYSASSASGATSGTGVLGDGSTGKQGVCYPNSIVMKSDTDLDGKISHIERPGLEEAYIKSGKVRIMAYTLSNKYVSPTPFPSGTQVTIAPPQATGSSGQATGGEPPKVLEPTTPPQTLETSLSGTSEVQILADVVPLDVLKRVDTDNNGLVTPTEITKAKTSDKTYFIVGTQPGLANIYYNPETGAQGLSFAGINYINIYSLDGENPLTLGNNFLMAKPTEGFIQLPITETTAPIIEAAKTGVERPVELAGPTSSELTQTVSAPDIIKSPAFATLYEGTTGKQLSQANEEEKVSFLNTLYLMYDTKTQKYSLLNSQTNKAYSLLTGEELKLEIAAQPVSPTEVPKPPEITTPPKEKTPAEEAAPPAETPSPEASAPASTTTPAAGAETFTGTDLFGANARCPDCRYTRNADGSWTAVDKDGNAFTLTDAQKTQLNTQYKRQPSAPEDERFIITEPAPKSTEELLKTTKDRLERVKNELNALRKDYETSTKVVEDWNKYQKEHKGAKKEDFLKTVDEDVAKEINEQYAGDINLYAQSKGLQFVTLGLEVERLTTHDIPLAIGGLPTDPITIGQAKILQTAGVSNDVIANIKTQRDYEEYMFSIKSDPEKYSAVLKATGEYPEVGDIITYQGINAEVTELEDGSAIIEIIGQPDPAMLERAGIETVDAGKGVYKVLDYADLHKTKRNKLWFYGAQGMKSILMTASYVEKFKGSIDIISGIWMGGEEGVQRAYQEAARLFCEEAWGIFGGMQCWTSRICAWNDRFTDAKAEAGGAFAYDTGLGAFDSIATLQADKTTYAHYNETGELVTEAVYRIDAFVKNNRGDDKVMFGLYLVNKRMGGSCKEGVEVKLLQKVSLNANKTVYNHRGSRMITTISPYKYDCACIKWAEGYAPEGLDGKFRPMMCAEFKETDRVVSEPPVAVFEPELIEGTPPTTQTETGTAYETEVADW